MSIFSFGYYGWGSYTSQLLEVVDAVEASRGCQPPIFVDTRIRRAVRAEGFSGSAFEKLLGLSRYRWMKSLGNKRIETRTGPAIQIAEPGAVNELLDLAVESARSNQRLIFFCSCDLPCSDGKILCHRATVSNLTEQAAEERGLAVNMEEWPGGSLRHINIEVSDKELEAICEGKMYVPLRNPFDLIELASLPWCSTATFYAGHKRVNRLVGPVARRSHGWVLPVAYWMFHRGASLREYQRIQPSVRKNWQASYNRE